MPTSQTVAQYWTIIVFLVWTVENFKMLHLQVQKLSGVFPLGLY